MNKLKLIAMALIVLALTSSGYAVIAFEDNFSGPPGGGPENLDPYWTWTGPMFPDSHFTDTGDHFQLGSDAASSMEMISHVTGPGDYTAELQIDNFNMAGTTDNQWQFLDFETVDEVTTGVGGGLIQMLTIADTEMFLLSLVPLNQAPVWSVDIGMPTSLDLRVTWADDLTPGATGTFSAEYNLNDAGWLSMGSFVNACEAQLERTESIFVFPAAANAGNGQLYTSMDLDNYSIVPEPATMMLLGLGAVCIRRRRR